MLYCTTDRSTTGCIHRQELEKSVNPRERVLTAFRRQTSDRVPKTMSLCPTHLVKPEVLCENIVAFMETVGRYGVYA